MKTVLSVVRLLFAGVLLSVEGVFWLLHGVGKLRAIAGDVLASRQRLQEGDLYCPRGHRIPIEGDVYECGSCGFTYEGSIFLCPNPECEAPVSPFVDGPICRLSVRNPWRWGHP